MRKIIAVLALVLMTRVVATQAQQQKQEIRLYPLPADVIYPEGIAYDAKSDSAFALSVENGSIGRVTLDGKESKLLSPPGALFIDMHGMRVDAAGRLWAAGGRSGRMAVLDPRTGTILKSFSTPAEPPALINDVAVVGSSAYFTDTWRPTLWRITAKGSQYSEAEPWLQFKGTQLAYAEGPNLNGIAASADGKYLVVVQTNSGRLYRIGIADKSVVPIDVGGETFVSGDGVVLDTNKLYVVRLTEQMVVTIEMSKDLSKGRVMSRFTNPALQSPTTAVKAGNRLLVANSQMSKRNTKSGVLPFTIVSIPLSMLSGK